MFENGYYVSEELLGAGFKKVGKNVKIAKNCVIIGPENISIGDDVRIDGGVYIIAIEGFLDLGNYIHISAGCYLQCAGGIILKDYCGLSSNVCIYSSCDDYSGKYLTNSTVPQEFRKLYPELVTLEEHVIIGAGTAVMAGSNIGQGCAVGAMSLVTRNLEEWGIYFGSPVKRIKNRKKDLLKYC